MSAYTGYLIRTERLAQNFSQEGLAKGICAVSYLSKIEQGQVEPGAEIINRLFSALHIDFVRDPALEEEAQRQLDRFFFLMETGEPYEEQKAFFSKNRERLCRSEFAIKLKLYELVSCARLEKNKNRSDCSRSGFSSFNGPEDHIEFSGSPEAGVEKSVHLIGFLAQDTGQQYAVFQREHLWLHAG